MVLKCLKEQGPYPNVIVKSYYMLSKDKIYHPKCLSKIGIINNSIFPLNAFYGQKGNLVELVTKSELEFFKCLSMVKNPKVEQLFEYISNCKSKFI